MKTRNWMKVRGSRAQTLLISHEIKNHIEGKNSVRKFENKARTLP